MSLKKFFLGEPMPDKNDPKYRERYEREVEAGRRFASATGISRTAGKLQQWGQSHKKAFLAIVFGIVVSCFVVNVYHLCTGLKKGGKKAVAVERVEKALGEKMKHQ